MADQGKVLPSSPSVAESPNILAHDPSFSPSPSPALSAQSYTSSSSSEYDSDFNQLVLDDWGYPGPKKQRHGSGTSTTDGRPGSLNEHTKSPSGTETAEPSGANTPVRSADSSVDPLSKAVENVDEDDQGDEAEGDDDGFDALDENEEDLHASGIPAARGYKLNPKRWDTNEFKLRVLELFVNRVKLAGWDLSASSASASLPPLEADSILLKRVSGAFTNAVFFVSHRPKEATVATFRSAGVSLPPTVLLRIYGSGSEVLLSRRAELLILHTLSSLYEIGPHILGTFGNGRIEEFYECETLGKERLCDLGDRREIQLPNGSKIWKGKEKTGQWVARRMRELHEVPIDVMKTVLEQGDLHAPSEKGFGRGIENHIMASSHRPRKKMQSRVVNPSPSQAPWGSDFAGLTVDPLRSSPAPMTPTQQDTSIAAAAADGARAQALAMQGYSPHRNSSVASFDSLATSFDSRASFSSTASSESLLASPAFGPRPSISGGAGGGSSSYFAQARGTSHFPPQDGGSPYTFNIAPPSSQSRSSSRGGVSRGPYPGVWRRAKRWTREAAKVLAVIEEFCNSPNGTIACERALAAGPTSVNAELAAEGAPFSESLGPTKNDLCNMLRCIAAIDFPTFVRQLEAYKQEVRKWEKREGISKRVFSHNDSQYVKQKGEDGALPPAAKGMPRAGNSSTASLDLSSIHSSGTPTASHESPRPNPSRSRSRLTMPHQQLVVIDFEYASPNPRAYDIGNHFNEFRSDFSHPTHSYSLTHHAPYPSRTDRRRWLRAYVEQGRLLRMKGGVSKSPTSDWELQGSPQPDELILPPSMLEGTDKPKAGPVEALANKGTARGLSSESSASISSNSSSSPSGGALPTSSSPSVGPSANDVLVSRLEASIEREVDRLEKEITVWGPASHAVWGLWGIVFARDDIEALLSRSLSEIVDEQERQTRREADPQGESDDCADPATTVEEPIKGLEHGCGAEDFDNLRYSLNRIELFRQEINDLGIKVPSVHSTPA